ncbi:MAG: alpha/beta hydrolase fold domain-containing protein [Lachnospiraceae bacterium]|nr:alpha/beta hydrolase fold domain-containing protein [Lachnospiraceae bacterium]
MKQGICLEKRRTVLGREIRIHMFDTGAGLDVLIEGGDRSHIGAVAVAGPGMETHEIVFPGHKEGCICRRWAEALKEIYHNPVTVKAGIHYDNIGRREILEILDAMELVLKEIVEEEMNENISITNKTMELSDCKDSWFFDETYRCWCLEDILYTERATTPKFQRLSIFVPEPYMKAKGEIDREGSMNGYTAETVPVVFGNNSAGYMQMPHVWLGGPRCSAEQYLEHGFVYVACGNRGSESRDENGELCGKAPANLVDLKTAIRFLRHNAKAIPGNLDHIISVGWSAGGAMSSLLAVTGNNANFDAYLKENGAFMEERDDIYAAQMYCPIVDLEHSDQAYEWMFSADKENENSPAGPAGVMTPFQEALSAKLKEQYIQYFNSLGLESPLEHQPLLLKEDGRSGSAYDYLMNKISESATVFLQKLQSGELEVPYSVEDYLNGNYEYLTMAPMGGKEDKEEGSDLMQGHAGPGVALQKTENKGAGEEAGAEPPSLGDLVSRPPKGVPYEGQEPPMVLVKGNEKKGWLSWNGREAVITDLDTYVLQHRRRMKPCTSFDTLGMDSGENRVFGSKKNHYMHFNRGITAAIAELKDEFPEEYKRYYDSYAAAELDPEQDRRIYLINPLNYIGTEEKSDTAAYYRIRVGASDADTAFTASMILALKLAAAGKPVDYELVWDRPHSEADYPGDVCRWIDEICGEAEAAPGQTAGQPETEAAAGQVTGQPGVEAAPGQGHEPVMADISWINRSYLDIPYGEESKNQRLDLFLPEEGQGPFPVLVYTHGGGFAFGDKRDFHLEAYLEGVRRGFAVAAVEYRLSGEAIFPAAVLDCREAVRFLKAHAKEYGLDPERMVSIGGSAGGNLAAMLAMNIPNGAFPGEKPEDEYRETPFVAAAVDQFGPMNFKTMDDQARANGISFADHDEPLSPESKYLGIAVPEASKELCAAADPASYISEKMSPILVQHGTVDRLVPQQQSLEFVREIKERIGEDKVEFAALEGAEHDDPMFGAEENLNLIFDFLRRRL